MTMTAPSQGPNGRLAIHGFDISAPAPSGGCVAGNIYNILNADGGSDGATATSIGAAPDSGDTALVAVARESANVGVRAEFTVQGLVTLNASETISYGDLLAPDDAGQVRVAVDGDLVIGRSISTSDTTTPTCIFDGLSLAMCSIPA